MNEEKHLSKNIAWNTIGSLINLACQWLLSVLVVVLSGDFGAAGILSLSISVAGVFFTIALFNVRFYQVSNQNGLITLGDYISHRIFTCFSAFLLCFLFVVFNGYSVYTALSILGIMLLRVVEAFADVLHGEAQRKWRFDIIGKSNIIRGILLVLVFSVTLVIWQNLSLSILLMAASNIVPLLLYDYVQVRKLTDIQVKMDFKQLKTIFKICLPMMIYGLCLNSIMPMTKYFLELFHGEEVLGYFASVSTIAVLVQTTGTLVFSPFVGMFSEAYRKSEKIKMLLTFIKICAFLVALTVAAFLATAFLGEFALSLIFGKEIIPYVYLLYPTIISSTIIVTVTLLGMILVVIEDSKTLLAGSVFGFLLALILSMLLIKNMQYDGTNITVIVSLSAILIIYLCRFFAYIFKPSEVK